MSFEEVNRSWDALKVEILTEESLPLEDLMPTPFASSAAIDALIAFNLREISPVNRSTEYRQSTKQPR